MVVNPNFTPIFDPISDEVHYNISQMIATQPPLMTTATVWIIFALLGIALLIYSVERHEHMAGDLAGILASVFLLLTALQSFAVDTVTSSGVSSICESASANGICLKEEWVSLESHQIYHYDLLGWIFALLFIISIANLFLLWIRHRRITEQTQETIDHKGLGNQPQHQNQKRKETGKDDD